MVQKLMMQQAVDQKGARYITDTLWMLMESGTEEVKVLQSVTLLLTTNTIVHGDTLARVCIIASRLLSELFFQYKRSMKLESELLMKGTSLYNSLSFSI
jgi:hypothetical protein